MDKKIQKFLEQNKIKYKILEHRKVYTAFNEAETQHVDPKTVIKTVFVKFSKLTTHLLNDGTIANVDCCLVAIPAKKRVNIKKVAATINKHQDQCWELMAKADKKLKKFAPVTVKMANEKDILHKLKTKVGLLHPFSSLYHIPLLVDKKLLTNKKLITAAGSYTESLELSTKDFLKLLIGIAGSFTE